MKRIRVILNGKSGGNPEVRTAVNRIRDEGQAMEVRCTWEGGDAARLTQERSRAPASRPKVRSSLSQWETPARPVVVSR
ncbi:MAG: hypothetical protein ACC742_03680 [Thermoanaerobaculales bacterium]